MVKRKKLVGRKRKCKYEVCVCVHNKENENLVSFKSTMII